MMRYFRSPAGSPSGLSAENERHGASWLHTMMFIHHVIWHRYFAEQTEPQLLFVRVEWEVDLGIQQRPLGGPPARKGLLRRR